MNEMARELPDGGELIEFWITSTLAFNDSVLDPAANSGIGFGPLQWLPLAESPVIVGIDTTVFDDPATPQADAPYGLLELAFGLAGQTPNDLRFGIVVDHAVPEPAGAPLLGLALGALGLTRRLH